QLANRAGVQRSDVQHRNLARVHGLVESPSELLEVLQTGPQGGRHEKPPLPGEILPLAQEVEELERLVSGVLQILHGQEGYRLLLLSSIVHEHPAHSLEQAVPPHRVELRLD